MCICYTADEIDGLQLPKLTRTSCSTILPCGVETEETAVLGERQP